MIKKYLTIIIITFVSLIIFFLLTKYEKELENKLINETLKEKLTTEKEYDKIDLNEINNKELLNIYINENLIPLSDKNNFFEYFSNIVNINLENKNSENKIIENNVNNKTNKTSINSINKNKKDLKVSFPIDINTATYNELVQIPGIGDTLAKRILEYREKNGKFTSIDELLKIKGIGQKTFEKIKNYFIIK